MLELFSLSGRVALVTGAGRGIGATIATAWARAGADVACLDLDPSSAEATADQVRATGRRAVAIGCDVTDADAVADAVARTVAELGGLHVALNNAGVAGHAPAELMGPADWRRMVDVDLTSVFLCAQAEARVMLPAGVGSIVNTASMSATIVNRGQDQAHYNAAKAGVVHLTRSLAVEWAARGVRVNCISPGYTLTAMTDGPELADRRAVWAGETPMGRMVDVEELTGPALFLASDAASAVTGVDLLVDCGYTCW